MPNPPREQPPSFQFYPRDFLSSTSVSLMTPEARGGYVMLLAHAWLQRRQGWLPDDDSGLAAMSGLGDRWAICRDSIARAFTQRPGFWVQRRMVVARAKQRNFSEAQRNKANARWAQVRAAKDLLGIVPAMPNTCFASASASASASALESKDVTTSTQSPRKTKPRLERIPIPDAPSLTTNRGEAWQPTQQEIDAWASAYPGLDVIGTIRESQAWLIANPNRRKTLNGMARFVNGWLSREQNKL